MSLNLAWLMLLCMGTLVLTQGIEDEACDPQSESCAEENSKSDDVVCMLQIGAKLKQQEQADPDDGNMPKELPLHPKDLQMMHTDLEHYAESRMMDAGSLNAVEQILGQSSHQAACIALWHGASVLGSDDEHKCHWSNIHGDFLSGGLAPRMCVREYSDVVSDNVKKEGAWTDCPPLASWWEFLPDRSSEADFGNVNQCDDQKDASKHAKLYVDIGANIGSCLMPMIARPDVDAALAFEPNPKNLFYLTSSILANADTKAKIRLYPVALGNRIETQPIYSEKGNAGNTVVGQATHTDSQPTSHVAIDKLDQFFREGTMPPYIHLMKIDAQGFEVKILEGAKRLFASGAVNAVKFELATDWLVKQGTSSAEYMNTFLGHGFQIYDTDSKKLVWQNALHDAACATGIIKDFVAVRLNRGEVAAQKLISCGQA